MKCPYCSGKFGVCKDCGKEHIGTNPHICDECLKKRSNLKSWYSEGGGTSYYKEGQVR